MILRAAAARCWLQESRDEIAKLLGNVVFELGPSPMPFLFRGPAFFSRMVGVTFAEERGAHPYSSLHTRVLLTRGSTRVSSRTVTRALPPFS